MEIQYKNTKLRSKTLQIIEEANYIIKEYQEQGFELTVRQIYYQFISRDLLPNNLKSYGLVGAALNRGRMCGLIDWVAIVDRTRIVHSNPHWSNPGEILKSAANSYRLDIRSTQRFYIEVWIEKNALIGVIEPICRQLDVTYLPCIGYYSVSSMWRAAQRFISKNKPCVILHLGDHDPSGLDMTKDIQRRLKTFEVNDITVNRIALNMDQIKKYNPPPNPAKMTDSRFADYVREFGTESWELDALSPKVISDLIKKEINKLTDSSEFDRMIDVQEDQRLYLENIAENYEDDE